MAKRKLEVVLAADAKGVAQGFGEADKAVDGWAGKLQSVGEKIGGWLKKGAMAGGAALGAGIVAGVMSSFDRAALEGTLEASLGATPEVAGRLGEAAGDAYASGLGGSLDEAYAAVEAVSSAFGDLVDSAEVGPMTEQALALAQAFQVDVNDALLSAGQMLKNGLVGDAQEAMDLLSVGLQGVPQAVRDEILSATQEYSKHFATLGISGAEAISLFRAADGVIGVDKLGDALKEMSIRATDMSAASVAAYDLAGLKADEMAGKILAGGPMAREGLGQIIAGLQGIKDPVDQANAAIALFGTPLEDLGVDQIPQFLSSLSAVDGGMGDTAGAAQEMADTLKASASPIEKFKRQALDKLTDVVETKVIPAVEKITAWAKENPGVLKAAAVVIGVVLVAAFVQWATAAAAAAAATLAATWPVLAVVAAVGLLAAGIIWAWENVDWFRGAIEAVASFLTQTLWPALTRIASTLTDVVVGAFNMVQDAAMSVVGWARDHWPLLLGILTGPIGMAVGMVITHWDTIKAGFTAVKDWISGGVDSIVGFIGGIPSRISVAASTMWSGITESFRAVLNTIIGWWNGLEFTLGPWTIGRVEIAGREIFGGATIGPYTFGVPDLPMFHSGGVVGGGSGEEVLALLQAGEVVLDRDTVSRLAASADTAPGPAASAGIIVMVDVTVEGSVHAEDDLAESIRSAFYRSAQRKGVRPLVGLA